jgi:hypothetical protein
LFEAALVFAGAVLAAALGFGEGVLDVFALAGAGFFAGALTLLTVCFAATVPDCGVA